MRYLITVLAVLALALAACQADDGSSPTGAASVELFPSASPETSGSPDMSADASTSPDASGGTGMGSSPDASLDASASPDGSFGSDASDAASPDSSLDDDDGGVAGGAGGDCASAFEEVPDLDEIETLGDFSDMLTAIDDTIEACESVDEWAQEAETALDLDDLDTDAEQFLRDRCEESSRLSSAALCEET